MNDQDPKVKSPVLEEPNQNTEGEMSCHLPKFNWKKTSTEEKDQRSAPRPPLVRAERRPYTRSASQPAAPVQREVRTEGEQPQSCTRAGSCICANS